MERLRLRRMALELVADAVETTDPAETLRLLARARVLTERADRKYGSDFTGAADRRADPLSAASGEPARHQIRQPGG
jgi:hypothetical protein